MAVTEEKLKEAGREVQDMTYLEALKQALAEELERDKSVFLLGEDIGVYGGAFKVTEGLLERFGTERVFDTPLAEEAIFGAAIGAALMGMRPVAEAQYADFIACGFDQLVNVAAKSHYRSGRSVPIVVRAPSGAGVRAGPFHSQSPEAWFIHTPGFKVVVPSTPYDAKGLLKAAIRDNNPVIFLEHKALYRSITGKVPTEDYIIPLSKADVKREGGHISVITYGAPVHTALSAAEELAQKGIEIEIVDLRTLKPWDEETVMASVRKTGRALLLQEDVLTLGIASEIAAVLADKGFEYLDAPIVRVTAPDTPIPLSPPLEDRYLPQVKDVVEAAERLAAY